MLFRSGQLAQRVADSDDVVHVREDEHARVVADLARVGRDHVVGLHRDLARAAEMRGDRLYCWGGGGITASSDWAAEYQETLDKVGPIMRLLEQTS